MLGKAMVGKLGKIFKGLWSREDGTTAIEFSLLFIPYLTLSLGIIELALMYSAGSLLEGATGSAARLIRTGQVQQAGGDQQQMFRDAVCGFATVLIDCDDVQIEVQQLASFSDVDSMNAQYDEDGNFVPQGFDPGGSNDRVLIRVAYRYTMMTPFIGPLLAGPDNSIQFLSTIVLQTEPYEFAGNV
ncbi:MAG: pilus assembly protein [Alphaproteobacteria bacterium]|nr:pilus assembly protein [Alphaproteobacteria bacterium]